MHVNFTQSVPIFVLPRVFEVHLIEILYLAVALDAKMLQKVHS